MEMKFFLIIVTASIFSGCTKDQQQVLLSKPAGCDSSLFSYQNNIRPLIAAICSGPTCHSGGNSNYDFSSYEVLSSRIREGTFEERLLLSVDDPRHMPPGIKLGACDLFTLRLWIHQGFKNN